MEKQFIVSIPGQEVESTDLNSVSENAALGGDRTLDELLRLTDNGGPGKRGILPYSSNGYTSAPSGVLEPSGAADASIRVRPFRPFIGAGEFAPGHGGRSA